MRTLALVLLNLTFLTLPAQAADILAELTAASRTVDWTNNAGVPGGIPARPTICQTLGTAGQPATFVQSVTAAQINSALNACTGLGQTVFLNAGRYNLTTAIDFTGKQKVTLRGAGADLTKLVFSDGIGCGQGNAVVMLGNCNATYFVYGGISHTNWTAGYTRETTNITVASSTNISVGQMITLDQLQDTSETGGVVVSSCPGGSARNCGAFAVSNEGSQAWGRGVCATTCNSLWGDRAQVQVVLVTAINGNVLTISPGLYMTNWRAGLSPQAFYFSSPSTMGYYNGIEDVTVDTVSDTVSTSISAYSCYACWVKGVRTIAGNSQTQHIYAFQSARTEVRNNYFYGANNSNTTNYGVVPLQSSDTLIVNNIGEHIAGALTGSTSSGTVFAYNYTYNVDFDAGSSWQQASYQNHGPDHYFLSEGNDVNAHLSDNLHGASPFLTDLRNYYAGREGTRTGNTTPIHPEAFRRGGSYIGNVLGTIGYHTTYQVGASGSPCSETVESSLSIYSIGYGGNFTDCTGGLVTKFDTLTLTTMVRWGNYDMVNRAARFVAGEVAPAGAVTYMPAVTVPSTPTIPATFFLTDATRTSWWGSPYGTVPWPPFGPDVTGGNIPNTDGHANKIPARLCWGNMSDDPNYPSPNIVRQFNASTCYRSISISGDKVFPAAPVNLKVF